MDLSFLKNHRSNWVVIIGLDLLSLACPGMGLDSGYVLHLSMCHPIIIYHYGYLILLVWIIGFDVIGMELVCCDTDSSRLCAV
jgi:hypothetical protein